MLMVENFVVAVQQGELELQESVLIPAAKHTVPATFCCLATFNESEVLAKALQVWSKFLLRPPTVSPFATAAPTSESSTSNTAPCFMAGA
mmetsp:Transcript_6784/g.15011  ORF Transcript_6784/g.15011 Transcript_6784/m.15011 type:complete len:90 (+) Transcript_6784:302-571(+)